MRIALWTIGAALSLAWVFFCIQTIISSNETTKAEVKSLCEKIGAKRFSIELEKAIIKNKSCLMPYQVDSVYNSMFK